MCDNKTIIASNGAFFDVCISYELIAGVKYYYWPLTIPVPGGTLWKVEKYSGQFVYNFVPKVIYQGPPENGNGNGELDIIKKYNGSKKDTIPPIIPGVDNTVLIIAGLGLFFLLQS